MIVLEVGEEASGHGVLEEGWALVAGDDGLVPGGQSELPSAPEDVVVLVDETSGLAGYGSHLQRLLDDGDAGREEEAAVEGCVDVDGFLQAVCFQYGLPSWNGKLLESVEIDCL